MERLELWEDIESVAVSRTESWLVGGDFNVILNAEEKLGGLPFTFTEASDFAHCINNCALTDLQSIGSQYTWWNGKIEEDCIIKKLDRILVNQEFLELMPSSKVQHLIRQGSDHAPLLVECNLADMNVIKPFKFFNFWTKHPEYLEVVKEAWQIDFVGDPFSEYHAKMKRVKKALTEWSKKTYGNIFEKMATLEDLVRVKEIQLEISPTKGNRCELSKTEAELRKYLNIEEEYWRQKAGMK
ncbi:hypothetical protein KY290_021200 [Solanum tuberosum]|uniref:Uncharacterized protein n=1 Tax=Solanum tuberosum TaxID=4113 RepID=A0ABQ7V0W0_SOLTU|nr:hypothetical protein KY285_020126 [Solanum tuberosum]KAH0757707.1 hypothetical protein KY290_021200 [Solanum tuberosum]